MSLFVFLDVTPGEFFRIIISSYTYTYVNNYKFYTYSYAMCVSIRISIPMTRKKCEVDANGLETE